MELTKNGIDIFLSYLFMMLAIYFFQWHPFNIFFSFLVEFIILLLMYVVVDQIYKNERGRKDPSGINAIFGALPLVLIQISFIWFLTGLTDANELPNDFRSAFNSFPIVMISTSIIIIYLLRLINLNREFKKREVLRDNVIFHAIGLSITNALGILIVFVSGIHHFFFVCGLMVVARIVLEIYFQKKIHLL